MNKVKARAILNTNNFKLQYTFFTFLRTLRTLRTSKSPTSIFCSRRNQPLGFALRVRESVNKMDSYASETGSDSSSVEINVNVEGSEIRKLLECPVCYDVILPPITLCSSGHLVCNSCRENLRSCPTCRGKFTAVRNLFAENFLDRCLVKCKYKENGCETNLSGRQLSVHHENCNFRPLLCRECDKEIPYGQFLEHLRTVEKLETQKAAECSTGFEIEDEELTDGEKLSVWEPTWIHCHGQDFFCFLETVQSYWWIWIGAFAPPEVCQTFVCSIMMWNKEKQTELKYVGTVHPIRTSPEDVLKSGQCLIFLDVNLKNFMYKGGIDVLVRIDNEYQAPKTRRGTIVESPLSLFRRDPTDGEPGGSRANRVQVNRLTARTVTATAAANTSNETLADVDTVTATSSFVDIQDPNYFYEF